ncbi:unnamed protein product [Vitrella brassicaformis CCMP3155]|uniref:Uncharacterized protein n=1 Tax=Vitrella brassicaformis (strain CCMP3155) TaxID=1169540 RepID=A0A0G4EDI7_VITBC|nr:unnamed protein product [Vitrella brassicaformis CCMP3155]|eukprot:CEL93777.1 unnamed protein product [Vitrella brassicaformis CCMP3155]
MDLLRPSSRRLIQIPLPPPPFKRCRRCHISTTAARTQQQQPHVHAAATSATAAGYDEATSVFDAVKTAATVVHQQQQHGEQRDEAVNLARQYGTPKDLVLQVIHTGKAGIREEAVWQDLSVRMVRTLARFSGHELSLLLHGMALGGYHDPLLLKAISEGLYWAAEIRKLSLPSLCLALQSFRRLRYCPAPGHLSALLVHLHRQEEDVRPKDWVFILRFMVEFKLTDYSALLAPRPLRSTRHHHHQHQDRQRQDEQVSVREGHQRAVRTCVFDAWEKSHVALGRLKPFELVSLCKVYADLGAQDTWLYERVCNNLLRHRQRLSTPVLLYCANVILQADLQTPPTSLIMLLRQHTEEHLASLLPRQVTFLLIVLRQFRWRDPPMLSKLGKAVQAIPEQFTPQELSSVVLSFAKLRYKHKTLFKFLIYHLSRELGPDSSPFRSLFQPPTPSPSPSPLRQAAATGATLSPGVVTAFYVACAQLGLRDHHFLSFLSSRMATAAAESGPAGEEDNDLREASSLTQPRVRREEGRAARGRNGAAGAGAGMAVAPPPVSLFPFFPSAAAQAVMQPAVPKRPTHGKWRIDLNGLEMRALQQHPDGDSQQAETEMQDGTSFVAETERERDEATLLIEPDQLAAILEIEQSLAATGDDDANANQQPADPTSAPKVASTLDRLPSTSYPPPAVTFPALPHDGRDEDEPLTETTPKEEASSLVVYPKARDRSPMVPPDGRRDLVGGGGGKVTIMGRDVDRRVAGGAVVLGEGRVSRGGTVMRARAFVPSTAHVLRTLTAAQARLFHDEMLFFPCGHPAQRRLASRRRARALLSPSPSTTDPDAAPTVAKVTLPPHAKALLEQRRREAGLWSETVGGRMGIGDDKKGGERGRVLDVHPREVRDGRKREGRKGDEYRRAKRLRELGLKRKIIESSDWFIQLWRDLRRLFLLPFKRLPPSALAGSFVDHSSAILYEQHPLFPPLHPISPSSPPKRRGRFRARSSSRKLWRTLKRIRTHKAATVDCEEAVSSSARPERPEPSRRQPVPAPRLSLGLGSMAAIFDACRRLSYRTGPFLRLLADNSVEVLRAREEGEGVGGVKAERELGALNEVAEAVLALHLPECAEPLIKCYSSTYIMALLSTPHHHLPSPHSLSHHAAAFTHAAHLFLLQPSAAASPPPTPLFAALTAQLTRILHSKEAAPHSLPLDQVGQLLDAARMLSSSSAIISSDMDLPRGLRRLRACLRQEIRRRLLVNQNDMPSSAHPSLFSQSEEDDSPLPLLKTSSSVEQFQDVLDEVRSAASGETRSAWEGALVALARDVQERQGERGEGKGVPAEVRELGRRMGIAPRRIEKLIGGREGRV